MPGRRHRRRGTFSDSGADGGWTFQKYDSLFYGTFREKRPASDFLDCFIKNGSLWLVFPYFAYTPLAEKMKEPFLQSERLESQQNFNGTDPVSKSALVSAV